jgi:hypothetical protein
VDWASNLTDRPVAWHAWTNVLAGAGGDVVLLVPNPADQRFYRLRVRVP